MANGNGNGHGNAQNAKARAKVAVAYLRVSTDKQPLSIADQTRSIRAWADARGITIVRWYKDESLSGATATNRAEFQQMITDVEQLKDVALVLCYDVSRFGRTDTDEAGFYRFRLRQAGAEVVYVAETRLPQRRSATNCYQRTSVGTHHGVAPTPAVAIDAAVRITQVPG